MDYDNPSRLCDVRFIFLSISFLYHISLTLRDPSFKRGYSNYQRPENWILFFMRNELGKALEIGGYAKIDIVSPYLVLLQIPGLERQ